MNFSFWPFLWFGLPGRLLTGDSFLRLTLLARHRQVTDLDVTVLVFSGPGLPSARQVLCEPGRPFRNPFRNPSGVRRFCSRKWKSWSKETNFSTPTPCLEDHHPTRQHPGPKCQQFTYGVFREGVIAQKRSANFGEISALSWGNETYFLQVSANFPQNFCKLSAKKPFANDPISELLKVWSLRSFLLHGGGV